MDLPFAKEAIGQLFSKSSCAMYPVVPSEAAPGYRGRIVYHADQCIGCGMCERVCAGGAITRTVEKVEEGTKITISFNLGSCTFCNTCADFCTHHAIELTTDYHMIATKPEDLIVTGSHVKVLKKIDPAAASCGINAREDGKPVQDPTKCVYCTLCAKKCPQGAITVDRANKTWKCNYDECVGCGTCISSCPKKALI
ncbi:MAG: 4Fe-4S binding protein [Candidatus Limivicinus sp.]|jgi:formate hydrogenlyase subunit 6/NADH:ubiquinone oxidoreductase subunit I